MTSQGFAPNALTINAGDAIIFFNKDTKPHRPAAGLHDNHDQGYSAGNALFFNQSVKFTFKQSGQWQYHDHENEQYTFSLTVLANEAKNVKKSNAVSYNPETGKENCVARDGHAEGSLTSLFDTAGNLVGWNCTMNGYMNCSAGPDGIWKTCDFPPDVMAWPNRITKTALDNPKAYSLPADY